ncbi:MAG TPA: TMEM175 family protein [Gammaproteobacteria bacterium]|nr:TMEM175 family protein [Gammaproteobacteria bacterium]
MNRSHLLKVSRLEGLTDGVFAIAMTILAFDLHLPRELLGAPLLPTLIHVESMKLFIYIGSFIVLGTLWIAMNFQLGLLERVIRPYLWANVFYLMIICIVPFSASIVAAFPEDPLSVLVFAINLIFGSIGQVLTIQSAHKHHLNKDTYTAAIRNAILWRVAIGPVFYISACFLAYVNTHIAFIVLVIPPVIYLFPGKIDKYDI